MIRILLLSLCLTGCGIKVGNPKKPNAGEDQSNEFYTGLSERISSQFDESMAAITSGSQLIGMQQVETPTKLATTGWQLFGSKQHRKGPPPPPPEPKAQSCRVEGAKVYFDQEFDHEFKRSIYRHGRHTQAESSAKGTLAMVWSDHGGKITCSNNSLVVPLADLTTYRLDATFNMSRKKKITDASNGAVLREGEKSAEGTRSITWQKVDPLDGKDRAIQTIDMDLTQKKDGQTASIKTTDSLQIEILIDPSTSRWLKQTIKKGALQSKSAQDEAIDSQFSDIRLDAGQGCEPQNGQFKGTIVRAAQPQESFDMEFQGGSPYLKFGDRHRARLVPDACSFE